MPAPASASLTCTGLAFEWPDGTPVLTDFDLAVGPGRTGLIGVNGSGKTTLLRLLAGELAPLAGSVRASGEIGYLPQNLTLDTTVPVDHALGIAGTRAALHAIEAGDASEANFTAVGDDWDVEERARAVLDQFGLDRIGLDRTVGELSGGETVLLRLAALLLARPDVLLLDEPTNNLDRDARHRLQEAVENWTGVLLVVSHDRELLERVDRITELRDGTVRWYGGNFSDYEAAVAAEQETAARMVRAAGADLKRQQRELVETRTKLARRQRYGQKMSESKREPKIVMGARKRQAQVSAGKLRNSQSEKVDEARERLEEAEEGVRDDAEIRVDLPRTEVPAGREVLTVRELDTDRRGAPRDAATGLRGQDLRVHGPERIALLGRNGSGKTTLLRTVAGQLPPAAGSVEAHVPVRYLPQRLDLLDDRLTVAENVGRFAPGATDNTVRARLARFLFRGGRADQPVGTLSGGERFRATLAALLLADPAPQLLMLDEPTNNLDLASVRQLTQALAAYRGALVVAGHDVPFLRSLGITRWLHLADGRLTDGEAPDA